MEEVPKKWDGGRDENYLTVLSTVLDTTDLSSTHEEADTKLILHAVNASRRGANSIRIFSSDTDVLVLAVRRSLDE